MCYYHTVFAGVIADKYFRKHLRQMILWGMVVGSVSYGLFCLALPLPGINSWPLRKLAHLHLHLHLHMHTNKHALKHSRSCIRQNDTLGKRCSLYFLWTLVLILSFIYF